MAFTSLNRPQPSAEPEEKYPALRVVLIISKLGVACLAIAMLIMAYLIWQSHEPNSVAIGLLTLLIGAMVCVFQWASIEVVEVLLDIEENTRRTADRGTPGTT